MEGGEDVFPFVLESLVGDTGGDLVSPSCLRMANWDMFFVLDHGCFISGVGRWSCRIEEARVRFWSISPKLIQGIL